MITYARESFDRVYSAKLFSISTLICLLIYFIILVIPFVLVFASNNFWIEVIKSMEQPKYTLLNEYFVAVLRSDQTFLFSNIQKYETAPVLTQLPDPALDTRIRDINSDEIADEINVQLSFGNEADSVEKILILLPIDVEITSANYKAKSLLMFDISASSSDLWNNTVLSNGCPTPKVLNTKYHSNFLEYSYDYDIFTKNGFDMTNIFMDYYTRDCIKSRIITSRSHQASLLLLNRSWKWLKIDDSQYKPRGQLKHTNTNQTNIVWIDKVSNQCYNNRFSWLQYCSVLIPVYIVGVTLLQFLYRFRFTHTHKDSNLPLNFGEF